jgi:hypothetical protein
MNDQLTPEKSPAPNASHTLLLVISWLWVGVPLAWGVLKTIASSMPLWD